MSRDLPPPPPSWSEAPDPSEHRNYYTLQRQHDYRELQLTKPQEYVGERGPPLHSDPSGPSGTHQMSMKSEAQHTHTFDTTKALELYPPSQQRNTKEYVASACVPCKRAHLRCDGQRPCLRCLSDGKEETCVHVEHKKRGRPRLKDEGAWASGYKGVAPGYPLPAEALSRGPIPMKPFSEAQMFTMSGSYRLLQSQKSGPMGGPITTSNFEHMSSMNAEPPKESPHSNRTDIYENPFVQRKSVEKLAERSIDYAKEQQQHKGSKNEIGQESNSKTSISSDYEEDTDWDKDEMSPSPRNVDSGNKSDCGRCIRLQRRATAVGPLLSPKQRDLVEEIMKELWDVWNQEESKSREVVTRNKLSSRMLNLKYSTNAVVGDGNFQGSSSSQDGTGQHNEGFLTSSGELNHSGQGNGPDISGRKHKRDSQGSQNEDEGDNQNPKRPRSLFFPPLEDNSNTKFACPYRKHNPQRYCVQHWGSCALTPLETVARVKQHLYRHHRIYPCNRCKLLFETQQEVSQHLNEPQGCELAEIEQAEGVTIEMVERLRCRKKAYKGQTEEERWEEIYKLLFPNEIVLSPYFEPVQEDVAQSPDSRALAEYEEYCRQELPHLFRARLEEMIYNSQHPFEETIRSQLTDLIRDCQDHVSSQYRAQATPNPTKKKGKSNPVTMTTSSRQNKSYSNRNASEIFLPEFLESPAPQPHLTSRLESIDLHEEVWQPIEKSLSDSGYTSDITPEHSHQNTMMSNSQPQVSPSEPTTIGLQKSHNSFDYDNEGDVRDTLENSWIESGEEDLLDEVDWSQFEGLHPDLGLSATP